VYMRGRLSERLRVAGEHWYPRDVEEALMRHPGIREAALIGLPDDELGHRPVACVTLQAGSVDSDEVIRFAERELGRDLAYVSVRVVEAMPMTPTGKISKAQLLDAATA
jgi:long-chain acyl-CoA synthetase